MTNARRAAIRVAGFAGAVAADAVAVALAWYLWMASMLADGPRWNEAAILGLVTWLVYAADRLADGLALKGPVAPPRHLVARRIATPLLVCWPFAWLATALLSVATLPWTTLGAGLAAAAAMAGYYLLALRWKHRVRETLPREVVVAAGFVAAVAFFPVARSHASNAAIAGNLAAFGMLALLNTIGIATWERSLDAAQDTPSLGRALPGLQNAYALVAVAGAVVAASIAYARVPGSGTLAACALGAMAFAATDRIVPRLLRAWAADMAMAACLLPPAAWPN